MSLPIVQPKMTLQHSVECLSWWLITVQEACYADATPILWPFGNICHAVVRDVSSIAWELACAF